jgi:cobalt-zinc-cadmium efflux system membrane fusion protein
VTATIPPGSAIAGSASTIGIEGSAPAGAVQIPASAVADMNGAKVVFLATKGGVRLRRVTVAAGTADIAVITSGLARGERVVTTGLSELATLAGAN